MNNTLMVRTSRDITAKDAFCSVVYIFTVLIEPHPTCSYKVENGWLGSMQDPLSQESRERGTER